MRNYKDLIVWQKSHELTLKIYSATKSFPKEELYGISSQMRRSSASIATNIAEGCGRGTDTEFKRFIIIASGSASELDYQLVLCKDLGYLSPENFKELYELITSTRKMLYALVNVLSSDSKG